MLVQWVSGICIFMLFYIWFFKKYQNRRCHIFTIYFAILGFSFISGVLQSIFTELQIAIRFSIYFIMEPLSILVLAFFVSIIALNKPISKIYLILILGLLVLYMLPHLPFNGAELHSPLYHKFGFAIIGISIFVFLSLLKTVRDYGEYDKRVDQSGLWLFIGVAYLQKVVQLTVYGKGFYAETVYSTLIMLMMVMSFLALLNLFYQTIIKEKVNLIGTISKTDLLAKEEDELVYYIHHNYPEFVNEFKEFGITDRELAIIVLTTFGISMKECADYLNVSVKTVEQYRYRLKKKIGLEESLAQKLSGMKV